MLYCFGYYHEPTNVLFVFITLIFGVIIFYSLFYWPEYKEVDRSKLDESEVIGYNTDVLGLEIPIYNDPVKNYKPMGGIGLKIGLFVLIAFLASMLIFKSFERVKPFHYVSNHSYYWGTEVTIKEMGNPFDYNQKNLGNRYKAYFGNFEQIIPQTTFFVNNNLEYSLKFVKEPYHRKN